MGQRSIKISTTAARQIAEASWFIESKGMLLTAERFITATYDFIQQLSEDKKSHRLCRDPKRANLGLKCLPFRKKYTIVFIETDGEIVIREFLPSKLIHW